MAQRLGVVAIQMERLLHRDGIGFDQAAETLQRNFGVHQSMAELADLVGRLPARTSRRVDGIEDEGELARLSPAGREAGDGTQERVRRTERREQAAEVERCLARAFDELEPEDRVILQLHFERNMTVAAVSRTLDLEQKPLYRRIDRCLKTIRDCLERDGVTAEAAADLVGWKELSLNVPYEDTLG
jgi:RNA polymerase sigma factor (sigma-70 family)